MCMVVGLVCEGLGLVVGKFASYGRGFCGMGRDFFGRVFSRSKQEVGEMTNTKNWRSACGEL